MSSLTRWVLAHKRIVVLTWVVLTIGGIAAAGPATDALDPEFSVPNKEGWETNVAIAQHYRGTGGGRSDDVNAVGGGLTYDMRRWLNLGAQYIHTNRSSNTPANDYDRNILMLSVGATL